VVASFVFDPSKVREYILEFCGGRSHRNYVVLASITCEKCRKSLCEVAELH
jgi:hypothetical protein